MELIFAKDMPPDFEVGMGGDSHSGSVLQSTNGIKRTKEWILSADNRYFLHHGDWIEGIMVDDKRLDDTAKTFKPMEQVKMAVDIWKDVSHRMIAGLQGNHEIKLWKYGDLAKEICDRLEIPYGTYTAKITYSDAKGTMFKQYATHGYGQLKHAAKDPEQRLGNMKASLKFRLKDQASDCVVMSMGHTHQLFFVEPARRLFLYDDGKKLKQDYMGVTMTGKYIHEDERYYLSTGSFYRQYVMGYSGYSEVRGYKPTELGFIKLIVRDRQIVGCEKVVV